jgi:hypothetical protein
VAAAALGMGSGVAAAVSDAGGPLVDSLEGVFALAVLSLPPEVGDGSEGPQGPRTLMKYLVLS